MRFLVPVVAALLASGSSIEVGAQQADLRALVYHAPAGGYLGLEGAVPIYDHSYAVVIGVSRYSNLPELPGAVHDAKDVARVLRDHGFEVELLLDSEATRARIAEALADRLPQLLKRNDRVLIYFAGHGVTVGSGEAQMGYLMPVEGDNERRASSGISMREIQAWIATYPSKHVLFAADSCYSGLALATRSTGLPTTLNDYLRQVTERDVRLAFTAGRADQEAHEWQGKGLFTYFFLQGLKGDADFNRDGILTSSELSAYLEPNVAQTALANWKAEQNPQMERSGQGEFIFLIRGPEDASPQDTAKSVKAEPEARGMPSEEADITFWHAIQDSSYPEDFEAYLAKFPAGVFADLAKTKLSRLRTSSDRDSSEPAEAPEKAGEPLETRTPGPPASTTAAASDQPKIDPKESVDKGASTGPTDSKPALGQAGSQAEVESWNQIRAERDRDRRIELDAAFLDQFPASGLAPYVHYDLATLYLGVDPGKFIQHGEEARQQIPGLADVTAYLAFYYAELDRPDDAEERAQLALFQLDNLPKPQDLNEVQWAAQKHALRAQAYYALGRSELSRLSKAPSGEAASVLDNAANRFNQAISHAPDHIYAWFRLGETYLQMQRTDDAVNAFARATALGGAIGQMAEQSLDKLYAKIHPDKKGLKQLIERQRQQAQLDLSRFRDTIQEEAGMPIRTKTPSLKGRKP